MSRPLTVAICQLRWSPDPGRNLDQGLAMAAEGFSGGANVVLLPELAVPGYTADPELLAESAQTLNGPVVNAWQRAAAAGGGYIVGGLCERDGCQLYDSAVMVSGDGLLTCYRKAHLFDGEKNVCAPGDAGFPVVSTGHGAFGICICYDLRFVEVLRILALQGAELVLVPSAWGSGRRGPVGPAWPGDRVAGAGQLEPGLRGSGLFCRSWPWRRVPRPLGRRGALR